MNINRDNYELFFLLYVDNELSAAERREVEAFIAVHPDLAIELSQLQETALPSESFLFNDKASLYRSSQEENTQETLLMHLDGELDMPAAVAAELLIASNDELQKQWELLQQCKLDKTEVVVFPNKASLYRKERDNVVVMRFVRFAVAAVLVGAGLFFAFNLVGTQSEGISADQVATSVTTKPGVNQPSQPDKPRLIEPGIVPEEKGNRQLASAAPSKDDRPVNKLSDKLQREGKNQVKHVSNDPGEQTLLAATRDPKQFERPSPERTNEEMALAQMNKVSKPNITDINVTPIDNSMARTAGLTNLETENEDKILYMEEDKITRSKAAGFLRKIKRTVERNARIKTGNGLRIAGFEIAAK